MAYDKVIDSSALTVDLTSVANAIRSKAGTTASLAFPTGFVDAVSKIETGGSQTEVREITIASDLVGKSAYRPTLFSGSEFIKKHYNDENLFIFLHVPGDMPAGPNNITSFFHFNRALMGYGTTKFYGIGTQFNSGGTSLSNASTSYDMLATQPYNVGFMVGSSGNVSICLPSNKNLAAGTYRIAMGLMA